MSNPTATKNYIASGAIAAYRFIKHGASDGLAAQAAAATDAIMGVSTELDAADAERVDVHQGGSPLIEYGGTIARGDPLTSDANGKAVTATRAAIKQAVVAGGAAGNITVTGVAAADTLISVIRQIIAAGQVENTAIAGGAAGNHTVAGIAAADTLLSVLALDQSDGVSQLAIAGGAAGNHTVTGIETTDTLISVIEVDGTDASEAVTDRTAEYTISAANTINNTSGTSSANNFLIVTWAKTAAGGASDLTSEFTISAANTINNTGGTSTANKTLLVSYFDVSAGSSKVASSSDVTAEFSITAANTINNTGGTSTSGDQLLVTYRKAPVRIGGFADVSGVAGDIVAFQYAPGVM